MEKLSHYDRLGLPPDASQDEIRHAYRQLVVHLHPDSNLSNGQTELFIDLQEAYDLLSDPKKKAAYDKQLAEEEISIPPIKIKTYYSQPYIVNLAEPQLIYAYIDFKLHPETGLLVSSSPMNISLIVDCSTSMQGMRLDTVKLTAIDLIRQLHANDIFSLVKFNDKAELLIPAGSLSDLRSAEMKIQLLQAGGGTEIFKGMEMGFSQVSERLSNNRVNHIILITDGRTYGDEIYCEKLADRASSLGIGISALGIGSKWNDQFLDRITTKTGGTCKYISEISDIRNSILDEISRLGSKLTEQVTYHFTKSDNIELLSAFRFQPDSSPLIVESPLSFGSMPQQGAMNILLEFLVKDVPASMENMILTQGFVNYEIPRHPAKTRYVQRLKFNRRISNLPITETPPSIILDAITMLSLYRMQERARDDMSKGDMKSATRHLEILATHLLTKGQANLAQSVMEEVSYIRKNQSFSEDGEKRIKYGTRSLLLPARIEEKQS